MGPWCPDSVVCALEPIIAQVLEGVSYVTCRIMKFPEAPGFACVVGASMWRMGNALIVLMRTKQEAEACMLPFMIVQCS